MKRHAIIALTVMGASALLLSTYASGKNTPVVPFDHKKHIEEVGVACLDCHKEASSATTSATMLLPRIEDCYECHDQSEVNWTVPADGSSPWPTPARELIFDHAKHMSAGLECATCHAGVEKATKAPSDGLPSMALCTDCHKEREVKDDCNVCHSQVQVLRPKDHIADWISDHSIPARSDARSCETCHRQSYCSECHDGAALGLAVRNKEGAPADRIGPMASAHEGNDLLILQRVHDLNYRWTHGSDVRAKTLDCAVCHETQTFCNACHNPENDANRLRPVWHDMANFEFYTHADFARRDIEVCAACHEQSGAEPTCMKCHKTIRSPHPDGFMKDNKGSWHDDPNAMCFVCHDNGSRTPGVGFCGKCHGRDAD
jgi:hypothetical protein